MLWNTEFTWNKAAHAPYINSSKRMGATDLPRIEERCLIQRNSQRCDDDQFKQKTKQKWNHTSEQYSHYQCLHYLKNPRHLINMFTRGFFVWTLKCNKLRKHTALVKKTANLHRSLFHTQTPLKIIFTTYIVLQCKFSRLGPIPCPSRKKHECAY